jgi:hypothetical protein
MWFYVCMSVCMSVQWLCRNLVSTYQGISFDVSLACANIFGTASSCSLLLLVLLLLLLQCTTSTGQSPLTSLLPWPCVEPTAYSQCCHHCPPLLLLLLLLLLLVVLLLLLLLLLQCTTSTGQSPSTSQPPWPCVGQTGAYSPGGGTGPP